MSIRSNLRDNGRFYLVIAFIVAVCVLPINYTIQCIQKEEPVLKSSKEYLDACIADAKEMGLGADVADMYYRCAGIASRACMVHGCRAADGMED